MAILEDMHIMDEQIIHERTLAIQQVIDLTIANGPEYLEKLKKFNAKFPQNNKTTILNQVAIRHEQSFTLRD